jgi:hypothetical protein
MKGTASGIGVLALAGVTWAGVVQLDVARRDAPEHLSRRSESFTSDLMNNINAQAYVATVKVGTQPQTVTLQVDTGSSDTWVPATNSSICNNGGCFYGSCKSTSLLHKYECLVMC